MTTTIKIPAETFPQKEYDGPILLTYAGADPEDSSPEGRLLKALIAQASGDRTTLASVATARSMEMGEVKPPAQRIGIELGPAEYEGEGLEHTVAVVPATMTDEEDVQSIPYVMVRERGQWNLDMNATMKRVFGVSMEEFEGAMAEPPAGGNATTMEIPAEAFPQKNFDGPVRLTYSGGNPLDPGPAGRVLEMIIAQTMGDRDALARVVTPQSLEMCRSEPPGRQLVVELGETSYEGEERSTAVVQGKVSADGNEQAMGFVVVRQPDGNWLVDMSATIDRLMGGGMEQLGAAMEQAMKGMGEAMGKAMGALGEGMARAFGGAGPKGGVVEEDRPDLSFRLPQLSEFQDWVTDRVGVTWRMTIEPGVAESESFLSLEEEKINLIVGVLRSALHQTITQDPSIVEKLRHVRELQFRKHLGRKWVDLMIDGQVFVYQVGETYEGGPDLYAASDELREVIVERLDNFIGMMRMLGRIE